MPWHFLLVSTFYQHDKFSFFQNFKLSGLSIQFNLKEATYCAIGMHLIYFLCSIYIYFFSSVAAIIGHLSFLLKKNSSDAKSPTLEQAVQIYQQSTCDFSVKQAVERLFEGYRPVNHGIFKSLFKHPYVDYMLVEEAIQIALNNCLCMISYLFIFYF